MCGGLLVADRLILSTKGARSIAVFLIFTLLTASQIDVTSTVPGLQYMRN